jgi:tetratricopeptide (TPR) repeat protein
MAIFGSLNIVQCKTVDEYLSEAEDYNNAGKLEDAISTMEEAVKEYPNNSMAYTNLGNFIGMQVQRMSDFSKITEVIDRAFLMWDKAISLDSLNLIARHYRGAWGVSTPKFMGKLEKGISDLEFLIGVYKQSTDANEQLVSAYNLLGIGYQKQGEIEKAKGIWNTIIDMAPETEYAKTAKENIDKIILSEKKQSELDKSKKPDTPKIIELKERVLKEPDNADLLIELGKAYFDNQHYKEAEKSLRKSITIDSSNPEAYKLLVLTLIEIDRGEYDTRIYLDTDFRTNFVFETMKILDEAVSLAPDDIELRFLRGTSGVNFPFFAGKLEQGIEDLNMVINSNAPDSTKSQAKFYLGFAYRKKAGTQWIDVVKNYKDSRASRMVFNELNPNVKRIDISKYKTPIVIIDFIMGFADELAPQTAVWVEDKKGKFIITIYVSGFSGHAKEKQVNLPRWAKSSKFSDTDGVTGASIDLGHHIYIWDLNDILGNKVKSGEYVIKVEVSYWPSMLYQWVSADINIGKKETRTIVEEGNFIPYLEVKYIP